MAQRRRVPCVPGVVDLCLIFDYQYCPGSNVSAPIQSPAMFPLTSASFQSSLRVGRKILNFDSLLRALGCAAFRHDIHLLDDRGNPRLCSAEN